MWMLLRQLLLGRLRRRLEYLLWKRASGIWLKGENNRRLEPDEIHSLAVNNYFEIKSPKSYPISRLTEVCLM